MSNEKTFPNDYPPTTHSYLKGYWDALSDFGIWKNGSRTIGCMDNTIQFNMEKKVKTFGIDYVDFMRSIGEYREPEGQGTI